jgi:hypothetical protein
MRAVAAIDSNMRRMARAPAACRRLMTFSGVGQLTALAFVATIAQIPLKKPSSILSDGEARRVSEKGWKVVWTTLSRHPGRYAASIPGSILIGLKRASRLKF